ncbi:MAG: ammonium transporter [Prevotellaceae bacterium]|nr:ammonium transporter [Prevotellaceae bacterium]MDY3295326.1 ammonium transporter [Bacteroidaceae bacterium]
MEQPLEYVNGLDTLWVLLGAMLVFWMQPGFALVEAGLTRSKNTANILMKNFCDFMCGSVLYWILGFSIMYGADFGLLGWSGFGFIGEDSNIPAECTFIFQTVFCATAATIVSGAMAERTKFSMYFVYSMLISAFVYPIEGHWSWGGGWLSEMGFHDFAGSTVVHLCGGALALAGAIVLGPRIGKYDKNGKSRAIPGHNLVLCALGVFCLWVGWFGFNPCSTVAATGYANAVAMSHIFVTTNMAAATGGISAMLYTWIVDGKPSLSMLCNGVLAGLVGITAGCDCVDIWASAVIGIITSTIMCMSVSFIDKKLHIDDPVGAVSVHGVGGIVGTILTGVFVNPAINGTECSIGVQTLGAVVVALFAFGCGMAIFLAIKYTHGLRCDKRIEEEGLDIYEHGETCYN